MRSSVSSRQPEQLSLLLSEPSSPARERHTKRSYLTLHHKTLLFIVGVMVGILSFSLESFVSTSGIAFHVVQHIALGVSIALLWAVRFTQTPRIILLLLDYLAVAGASSLLLLNDLAIVGLIQIAATSFFLLSIVTELVVSYFEDKTRSQFVSSFPILKVLSDSLSRNPLTLNPGVWIRIAQGESVPVDGSVISGESVVRSHHMQGKGGGIRICRAGDEVKAGELVIEGALAVKVERPWPYHEFAKLSRFAEECFDKNVSSDFSIGIFASSTLVMLIVASALSLILAPQYFLLTLLTISAVTLLIAGVSYPNFLSIVESALFGVVFKAGILLQERNSYRALQAVDGIAVAAGNVNYPVVRKEGIFIDVDPVQFAKIVINLIGPALDDWAVALKEYLIKKIPAKSSILQGVKSLSRFSANGFRAEYEGHEILIGDEAALRSRGIILELSEVSLSVKDSVVYFVALNGEVAARYEIELFPSVELSSQLEHASHHGVYVDVQTQKNLDPHELVSGNYKFFSRNKEYGFASWQMNLEPWQDKEIARCISQNAFIAVPKALIKVRILSHLERWSRVLVLMLLGLVTVLWSTQFAQISLYVASLVMSTSILSLIVMREFLIGLVASEKL